MSGLGFFSDEHLQSFALSLEGKVSAFVETGAEEGKTTLWAAHYFKHVFTCEIDAKYLRTLYQMLPSNVYLYDSSSQLFLVDIQPLAGDLPLFFLDAHWFDYWPLLDELKVIKVHYGKAVIIVHDCQVPGRSDFWYCRGGGADHDGAVLDWSYISQVVDAAHCRLFYPNYAVPKAGMPGYCIMFQNCEPMGNLKDMAQCPT